MIKILRWEDNLKNIAARWADQYSKQDPTYLRLVREIGENGTKEEIDAIIGNSSWTSLLQCSECEKETKILVYIGEEPDEDFDKYEARYVELCLDCVHLVANTLKESK
jgi:hypothetical protein